MGVIDEQQLQQLADLIGGDSAELAVLTESFLSEGKEIIAAMGQAIATTDLDTLRRGAHSMKSSALDFGATDLSTCSAQLEAECREGWPADAQAKVNTIGSAFELAGKEIKQYMSMRLPGSTPGDANSD